MTNVPEQDDDGYDYNIPEDTDEGELYPREYELMDAAREIQAQHEMVDDPQLDENNFSDTPDDETEGSQTNEAQEGTAGSEANSGENLDVQNITRPPELQQAMRSLPTRGAPAYRRGGRGGGRGRGRGKKADFESLMVQYLSKDNEDEPSEIELAFDYCAKRMQKFLNPDEQDELIAGVCSLVDQAVREARQRRNARPTWFQQQRNQVASVRSALYDNQQQRRQASETPQSTADDDIAGESAETNAQGTTYTNVSSTASANVSSCNSSTSSSNLTQLMNVNPHFFGVDVEPTFGMANAPVQPRRVNQPAFRGNTFQLPDNTSSEDASQTPRNRPYSHPYPTK